MFGLKAPNLSEKTCVCVCVRFVISKILSIAFILVMLLLSHINIAFQSTSIRLNLSESISKHKSYEYTNVILKAVIHLFYRCYF